MGDLGSVNTVVHQEQIDILGVVDEESLVAGGHHVASLLVRAEADLVQGVSINFIFHACRIA